MSARDGFLLAGGRSSRMGRDKALLELDGLTFAERIALSMQPLVAGVRAIGRADAPGIPALEDLRPGLGPLAGIETALDATRFDTALVVACDLPLVSTGLLALLCERSDRNPGAIVVAADPEGRVAPLCGIYPKAALAVVSALLDAGERRPRALRDHTASVCVPFSDYAHLPGAAELLVNVNTPEEYTALRRS